MFGTPNIRDESVTSYPEIPLWNFCPSKSNKYLLLSESYGYEKIRLLAREFGVVYSYIEFNKEKKGK